MPFDFIHGQPDSRVALQTLRQRSAVDSVPSDASITLEIKSLAMGLIKRREFGGIENLTIRSQM